MRFVVGLIAFSMFLSNRGYAEQSSERVVQVASVPQGRYVPLQALLDRRDGVPAVLERRITVRRQSELLQNVLVEVANQAGLGLSYSDELAKSQTRVSVDAVRATAADILTQVVKGTPWRVLVTPEGQVTVVRAPRTGSVLGQVTDTATKQGLSGVEIFLDGTQWRTETDTAGRYLLADVDAGVYTLKARRPGYVPESRRVTVEENQEQRVDIGMARRALALDELVSTATGPQRRRDLGNSITSINADSIMQTAPVRNLTDLLENKVPGMTMQRTSGAPGDPARIRLRGLGSALRSNDPIVIVDGVRVYSAQSSARSGNLTNLGTIGVATEDGQTNAPLVSNVPAPSPLDQIDPNTIEKIEVFKGPSAATLYGADAANGVIVVTTKKGQAGPTLWDFRFRQALTNTPGQWPIGYFRWGRSQIHGGADRVCSIYDFACQQDSLVLYQSMNDPNVSLLGQGRSSLVSLTASGGKPGLTYSVTGSYDNTIGLLQLPVVERQRYLARFNREAPEWMQRPHRLEVWSVQSTLRADIGKTAYVTLIGKVHRTEQQRSSLESKVPRLAGTYIDVERGVYYSPEFSPGTYNSLTVPTATTSHLQDYYTRTTSSTLNLSTTASLNWRPRTWFTTTGDASINVVPRADESYRPAGLISAFDSGAITRGTGRAILSSFNLQGALEKRVGLGFSLQAKIGTNLVTEYTEDVVTSAVGLLPGTSSITGADSVNAIDERVSTSVFGWYVESGIRSNRFSLSTGLRLDGGSAYGTNFARTGGIGSILALPKLNGAWVISEEPFFPFKSFFSSLKLRGAYGQAQTQPGAEDRLRTYTGRIEDRLLLNNLGNTQLRPERATEFEGGFEADILDSRVFLDFTAYRKTQVDAIMSVRLPNSVNGGGNVFRNVGDIRNSGIEITASITPIRSSQLQWSLNGHYSHNKNTILKLGDGVDPDPTTGLVAGYPLRSRWARPILGYVDENDNGLIEKSEIQLGDSLAFMGRLLPNGEFGFGTNLNLFNSALSITANFSYQTGGTQIDETARTNWVLAPALSDPETSPGEQAAVIASLGDFDDPSRTDYGLIQDISTFRFTSFSVNYRAPTMIARLLRARRVSVGITGSNLGLHSTYRGKDPNVTSWSPGESVVDTGQLPAPRTWEILVQANY